MGPYQPKLVEYPRTKSGRQYHRFQYTWFDQISLVRVLFIKGCNILFSMLSL
jgi:hypothetical protein